MGEKNSFEISRYKRAAALVFSIVMTAAVSALVTMSVLCDRGSADLSGTYELGQNERLSLLPCEADVDGGAAPFYIYEMSDDPDDDSLEVVLKGEARVTGKNCVVLYDDRGPVAFIIDTGEICYFRMKGDDVPKAVTRIDDEAVAL